MITSKTKSRAKQFAEFQDQPVKDFDPENDAPPESDGDSGDSEAEHAEERAATEHYVAVGKSKMRRKEAAPLGAQYRGARVSRADLEAESESGEDEDEDEDEPEQSSDNFQDAHEELGSDDADEVFHDPETADLEADHDDRDVEIDSDNAFGESDEEKFKDFTFRGSSKVMPRKGKAQKVSRPTAADFMASDEDEEEDDDEDDEDEEDDEDLDSEEDMVNGGIGALIDDEAEESEDEDDVDDGLDGFLAETDSEEEDGDEDDEDENDDDDDEEQSEGDEDDEDDDSADEEQSKSKSSQGAITDRSALADLVTAGNKSVVSALSEGQQKDVAKGIAIRQQRKAFDALLNVRIRLQKSLVAINTLSTIEDAEDQSEPYEAAEAAALKLWNAIDNFRSNLPGSSTSKTGQKRKREATTESTSQKIWANMESVEERAATRRRAVLQNWSQKANNIRTVDKSSRKFSSAAEKTLTARLDEELEAPERLIKRTRTPRSCAPAQVAQKVNEDANIYDDADFYQLLLKELVDQRTADTSGGTGTAATIRFAAVKEAKAKRHVDTKASKGRKMRFNVHDKLQNFMAPEDRRTWEQTAIDRLFGTLFGQKMELNEVEEESDEEMGGADLEEEGLRLFRN